MPGHIIHIGYSKAGSTFLQQWFQQHPQLFYAPGGLGGIYNVYEVSRLASKTGLDKLLYFVTSSESLCRPTLSTGTIPVELGLDSLDVYKTELFALNHVCQILKSLYPNAKILFITRGFKSIIRSGYSQYVKAGGIHGFDAFIERTSLNPHFKEEYDYTSIIDSFEEAFGPDNVITLPYELLRDNQYEFLTIIESRLGLNHYHMPLERINESLSPVELFWYPIVSTVVSKLAQLAGKNGYRKMYAWYIQMTLQNRFKKIIAILNKLKPYPVRKKLEIRDEMLRVFRDSNDKKYAARLRNNPLYQPYLPEYLLD